MQSIQEAVVKNRDHSPRDRNDRRKFPRDKAGWAQIIATQKITELAKIGLCSKDLPTFAVVRAKN